MGHNTDKTRTEDLTTDQRANRHPTKSGNYTEEAQNVMDDNIKNTDPLTNNNTEHARNKANEGKTSE